MRRWIARTAKGTVRLHHTLMSDAGRDFHDHPWPFTSFILGGGYLEHRPGCLCTIRDGVTDQLPLLQGKHGKWARLAVEFWTPCRWFGVGSVLKRTATEFHRLELPKGKTSWTLVFTGPYRRRWGFKLPNGRWVDADKYKARYLR